VVVYPKVSGVYKVSRLEHAGPCALHPSKLTFECCSKCGKPACQMCLNQTGFCPHCEPLSTTEKHFVWKNIVPSKTSVSLTMIFMVVFFALLVLNPDSPQQDPIIHSESISGQPYPVTGGIYGRAPIRFPLFNLIGMVEYVNDGSSIDLAPYQPPVGYPYALVPMILNPTFHVVPSSASYQEHSEPADLSLVSQPESPMKLEKIIENRPFPQAPFRTPFGYPYAFIPKLLNPPFQVVPSPLRPPDNLQVFVEKDPAHHLTQTESQEMPPVEPQTIEKETSLTINESPAGSEAPESNNSNLASNNLENVKTFIPDDLEPGEEEKSQPLQPPKKKKLTKVYASNSMANHLLGGNRFQKYHLDSIPTQNRIITLSFDGDHLDNCVSPILNILADKKVKANIFLTGKFIELFPTAVHSLLEEGHEIGNHTWNHPHLTEYEQTRMHTTRDKVSRSAFLRQLKRTSNAYKSLTGVHFSPYWRAPYGEHNLDIRTWAYSEGYLHIGWTRGYDTMDWMVDIKGKHYLSPSKIFRRLMNHLKEPGHKIVLMHLGSKREVNERPYQILAKFIDQARAEGYRFTTISEALRESQNFVMASRAGDTKTSN